MLSFILLLSGDMDPHHWWSARWFSKCDPQSGEQVIFLPLRSWAWRKLFLPWESLETTVMQHWLLVFLPNTSICFTRIFSCARMDPFYLKSLTIFFFFFLQLDRLPIIFQNRAWKLPHFWNLPEPKGRAHSEATLVFIFYHLELRSCLIKLCKSMSFYILFSFNPACKWTNFFLSSYFFFHENILNETYNKWCRLLVFCFPTSSLWVIFVLWSSF